MDSDSLPNAVITRRPFTRLLKGSVKVLGTALDAHEVVSKIILEKEGSIEQGTSLKISITPSRKKS